MMMKFIRSVLVLGLAISSNSQAYGQSTESDSVNDENTPAFFVGVKVDLQQVSSEVQQVFVKCTVHTEHQWQDSSRPSSGEGTEVIWQEVFADSLGADAAILRSGKFAGTVRVPIRSVPPYSADFWTRGRCVLSVEPSNTNRNRNSYPIRECAPRGPELSNPNVAFSCVWPGTDPKKAVVEFVRPGLGLDDSAVDDDDG